MDVVTVTTYQLSVASQKADAAELEKRLDFLGLQTSFDPMAKKLAGRYNTEHGLKLRTYYPKNSGHGLMIQDLIGWFGFKVDDSTEVVLKSS